jgi:serine/threonine protein kinase
MAKHFLPDEGHMLSLSEMGWLGDEGLQEQLGDDSYAVDDFGTYPSDNTSHPLKNGYFSPEFPFPFKHTGPGRSTRAADKNASFWGPLEMSSSMPSSLNPSLVSNSYDNRDFDVTDLSVLGQSSLTLVNDELPKACAPKYWDRIDVSTSNILQELGNKSMVASTGQQDRRIQSHFHPTRQKRKKPIDSVPIDEIKSNFIDRESALKLCIKHIPDPTIGVIESVAKDFGFPFEFVMDLCCQYRKNRNSDSLGFNNFKRLQHSSFIDSESGFTISTEEAPRSGARVDEATMTGVPAKRPKLDTEARQVAGKDAQTKSHRCQNCAQTFSRHPDLTRHQRTHFPAQIHCPYPGCNKSFTRKDKLNEHWRRRHSGDTSQPDITQSGRDEWEKDPDSGGSQGSDNSTGRGGNGQSGGSFQSSQTEFDSANQGRSSYGTSSRSSFSFEADLVEFHPVSKYQAMDDYLRNFAAAKVIQKLGRGGFGSVYKISVNTGSGAESCDVFACKTMSLPQRGREEVIERARNEITILQLLDHPQIVKFSGAIILRDRIFINSQPLADSDLKGFLAQQSPPISSLVKSQIWEGIWDLVSALAYLHGYGKGHGYHGDLKPENILVLRQAEPRPHIKFLLADFGSAWISTSSMRVSHRNQAATPRYCAPELLTDKSTIGPLCDVWSLGCVMAEIVTYLHDKTMRDFESFQPCNTDAETQWTYTESLPALKNWLRFLSLNCSYFAYPIIRIEHMDLIRKMLLPDAEDRLSAADVVNALEAIDGVIMNTVDRECNQPVNRTSKQPMSMLSQPGSTNYDKTASQTFEGKRSRRETSPQRRAETTRARRIRACKECRSRKVTVCRPEIYLVNIIPLYQSLMLTSTSLVPACVATN